MKEYIKFAALRTHVFIGIRHRRSVYILIMLPDHVCSEREVAKAHKIFAEVIPFILCVTKQHTAFML